MLVGRSKRQVEVLLLSILTWFLWVALVLERQRWPILLRNGSAKKTFLVKVHLCPPQLVTSLANISVRPASKHKHYVKEQEVECFSLTKHMD